MHPNAVNGVLDQASAYERVLDYSSAVPLLKYALDTQWDVDTAKRFLRDCIFAECDRNATAVAERLAKEVPSDDVVQIYLAMNRLSNGRYRDARSILASLPLGAQETIDATLALGALAYHEKRWDDAERYYLRGISRSDADQWPTLFLNLATVYERRNDRSRVETHFKSGLSIDPDNILLITAFADFLIRNRDLPAASAQLGRARYIAPDHTLTVVSMAKLFEARGQMEDAAAELKRLAEINPDRLAGLSASTWHLFRIKKYVYTIEMAQRMIELDPKSLLGNGYLIKSLLRTGKIRRALRAFVAYMRASTVG